MVRSIGRPAETDVLASTKCAFEDSSQRQTRLRGPRSGSHVRSGGMSRRDLLATCISHFDPKLPSRSSYCAHLSKARLNRGPNQFFDLQVPCHVYTQCLNFFARRHEVRYHDRHHTAAAADRTPLCESSIARVTSGTSSRGLWLGEVLL